MCIRDRARHALSAQPDLLTVADAGGNFRLDILAGGQTQTLGDAVRRVRQRHGQRSRNVRPGIELFRLECRTGSAAPRPSERFSQDVLETAETSTAPAAGGAAPRAAGKTLGAEVECLELGFRRKTARAAAGAAAVSFEAAESRLCLLYTSRCV